MCRLLFTADPTIFTYDMLWEQMGRLEGSAGGDGNGVALLNSREVYKGVDMTVEELAATAHSAGEPFIFHTRRASIGEVVDKLCQPFKFKGKKNSPAVIVAHNGHWGNYNDTLRHLLYDGKLDYVPTYLSDTLVGVMAARYYGAGGVYRHIIGSGVWLHSVLTPEGPVVTAFVNTGDLAINFTKQQAMSEPVLWDQDDEIGYVAANSIVSLYPKMDIVAGSYSTKPPHQKKGGKK